MSPLKQNKCGVICEWMQSQRVIVNPDGQVIPCCYIANVLYMMDKVGTVDELRKDRNEVTDQIGKKDIIKREFFEDNVLAEYYDNRDKFNIFKRPLHEIINDEWFLKTLPESWNDSDEIPMQCWWNCSEDGKISGRVHPGTKKHR